MESQTDTIGTDAWLKKGQKTIAYVGNYVATLSVRGQPLSGGDFGKALREVSVQVRSRLVPPTLDSEVYQTMLASQEVLGRDWDRPEEDAAWARL